MYTHTCINVTCAKEYESQDPDAYYCKSCYTEKKKIAAEVDAKIKARPSKREVKSELQMYDEFAKNNPQFKGFLKVSL